MLATPELIRAATQLLQLQDCLERGRVVPLYREPLARIPSGASASATLRRLPLLTKTALRTRFPENFLGEGRTLDSLLAHREIELEHTSGTSAERLPVLFERGWWNEQEARALRLNSVISQVLTEHPNARRATITSPACTGLTCPAGWLSREQRTVGNTFFVNLARIPFLLAEAELERMAGEIADWSPQFLDVSPVHGARFALFCEQRRINFRSLRFVLCSYEFVSVVHRQIIERVFGVPVFNLYGSTETGHLLMEDARGQMKPSRETAYLEIIEPERASVGELVVTTLSNDLMPLLRYRIGDLAEHQLKPYEDTYVVHGRVRDALTAGNRERVTTWQVDQCFAGVTGIAHYELRQMAPARFVLRYVAEPTPPDGQTLHELTARLTELLAPAAAIDIQQLPTLLPAASGKFRLTLPLAATANF